jgi:hypothetical protein
MKRSDGAFFHTYEESIRVEQTDKRVVRLPIDGTQRVVDRQQMGLGRNHLGVVEVGDP